MPDVRLPDGRTARFPDDMPREQIKAIIAEKFPQASPTVAAQPQAPSPTASGPLSRLITGKPAPVSTMEDVAKATGSGLVTGTEATLGLPGDVKSGMEWIGDRVGDFIFGRGSNVGQDWRAKQAELEGGLHPWLSMLNLPTSQQVASAQRSVTGFQPYQPQTTAGKFANTAAEFVPGAVAMGPARGAQGALSNAVKFGIIPGLSSEAAGQYAQAAFPAAEPFARFAGAMVGPMAAAGLRKAITPTRSDPYAQQAANVLATEGVDTTAGQRTGSHALRYAEDEIGGPRAAQFYDTQGEQFTRAVLRRAGVNADRATPQVMDQAFTDIGGRIGQLTRGATANIDQQLANDINAAFRNYNRVVAPNLRAPAIAEFRAAIMSAPNNQLTGQQYQLIRSEIGAITRQMATDGSGGYRGAAALRSFVDALDDAVERSINDPTWRTAFQEARTQYRNLLPIEETMARAGEGTAKGLVSPAALRSAVSRLQGKRNYVRGRGDYAALARAGESVLKGMPQSGTSPRRAARELLQAGPATAGGLLGYSVGGGDPKMAALGMLAGWGAQQGVNAGARSAMFSPAGRAYFANQLLPPPNYSPIFGVPPMLAGATLPARREVR